MFAKKTPTKFKARTVAKRALCSILVWTSIQFSASKIFESLCALFDCAFVNANLESEVEICYVPLPDMNVPRGK